MNHRETRALLEQLRYFKAYLANLDSRALTDANGHQPDPRVVRLRKHLSDHERALTQVLASDGTEQRINGGVPDSKSSSTLACVMYYAMLAEQLTYEDLARITMLLDGYVQNASSG